MSGEVLRSECSLMDERGDERVSAALAGGAPHPKDRFRPAAGSTSWWSSSWASLTLCLLPEDMRARRLVGRFFLGEPGSLPPARGHGCCAVPLPSRDQLVIFIDDLVLAKFRP